jgi:hypothetical protein
MAIVPVRPETLGAQFEHDGMVVDLVEQQFHSEADPLAGTYTLAGFDLVELRARVLTGLRELIARDRTRFDEYFVGGSWTVIEVRPGHPPTSSSAEPLGPYIE